ncbi:MAG TPA: 3-deoxy-manno-octulosonate cytidylyltransferase [Gemmatimonadales bacterium]|jgi:3-deoxy-manno-octulosonate cytidylyltransferase (CMP-KDO synthetase)|nr:3-deoxy-manno-octulosonate cytidylyltransferase [Gemmatimonadales bacterium]
MPVLVVIPARLGSTRLPRKPLQPLGGAPLIVRVAERIQAHGVADRLVIATDAEEIASVARIAGFEVVLTDGRHQSGTDRVFEASSRAEFSSYDEIVNVQGDAPFVSAAAVVGALAQLRRGFELGTAAVPLPASAAAEPSRVKVVVDRSGRALYFSRAPIPFRKSSTWETGLYWQHLGLYAYRRPTLSLLAESAPTPLERAEELEQLRALELGLSIGVEQLDEPAFPAVDTAEDLREAEELWTVTQEVTR